jgi:uncharacterized SAM-binding protein YcdF (DUF218 family)
MKEFLSIAIQPLSIFWFLVLLAILFYFLHKTSFTKKLLLIALAWLLIISTGFLPNLLISSLENEHEPFMLHQIADTSEINILVLGASHTADPKLSANKQLTSNALGRLVEGIRIHGLLPNSKLILSGGLGTETSATAEVMKQTALMLGVKREDIITLATTENTADEAQQYKQLDSKRQQLVLVTEAYHMPRSMKIFEKAGLSPIPAPSNYLYKRGEKIEISKWLPNANNIYKMEVVVHEYVGMGWGLVTGN